MQKRYKNYAFDLYGTLVDIHTDEESDALWERFSLYLVEHKSNGQTNRHRFSRINFIHSVFPMVYYWRLIYFIEVFVDPC